LMCGSGSGRKIYAAPSLIIWLIYCKKYIANTF
jgi:hypothetical protein